MPVWLLVADVVLNLVGETELSGRWLYVSIVAGALICAGAIVASSLSMLKRILLVFGSWLLLVAEVLILGVFQLLRSGLTGTQ